MTPEPSVIVEHLEYLAKRHGAATVARAIGVSPTAVSLVRKGTRPPSESLVARLLAVYPLTTPEPPAARRGAPNDKQNPHAVWLNTQIAVCTDTCREAEDRRNERDEIDRLVSHADYQSMRQRVLAVCAVPGLLDVLLPLPESGPTVAVRASLDALRASVAESRTRQEGVDPTVSSELYRRYSQFREALTRKLEKLERSDSPDELTSTGAWRATITTVCALLQPRPDERVRVVVTLKSDERNAFSQQLASALDGVRAISFPCMQYQNDPVGFFRDILGLDVWEGQVRILHGVLENKWVVVHTGHKIGKTKCLAGLSLWNYACFDDGRVILTNSTGDQLEKQDWFEIRQTFNESGICLKCRRAGVTVRPCPHSQKIDGTCLDTSKGGIKSANGKRWIMGSTAKRSDYAGGYSGAHLIVVCDEFSSMTQELYEAWIGNTAADSTKFIGVGNPIGQTGPMHDAVMIPRVRKNFFVINVSTEETIGVNIPGLGGQRYVDFVRDQDERGEESPFYMIRVKGLYPTVDEQAIYPIAEILRAQEPAEYDGTQEQGPLVIAIDPAGDSGFGDESVIGALRGLKCLKKVCGRGWSYDHYLDIVLDLIRAYRLSPNEVPIVGIDADGVGSRVLVRLDNYLVSKRIAESDRVRFEIVPVYLGQNAPDQFKYDLVGDEAHAHLSRWLRNGGVFEADPKLEQEMQISKWYPVRRKRGEREVELLSATRKDGPHGYRQVIHRSPDRLDMLRIFAYVSYMRDVLSVPDDTSSEAKQDAESQVEFVPVDESKAFREYIDAIRTGRMV